MTKDNKSCSKCKEVKSLDLFYKSKTGKYGVRSNCKVCFGKDTLKYQQSNKARTASYAKKHRESNKIAIKAKRVLYTEKNRDRINSYTRQYNKRDTQIEKVKKYRHDNRDHIRLQNQKYADENRGKVNEKQFARYHSKSHRTPGWYEKLQIEQVYSKCAELVSKDGIARDVDHVYPIRGRTVSGLHCWENLQILDASTNRSKSNKHPDDLVAFGWKYKIGDNNVTRNI